MLEFAFTSLDLETMVHTYRLIYSRLTYVFLLFILLQGEFIHICSSSEEDNRDNDICSADICEYTLTIEMQESLVYKPTHDYQGSPRGYFDVGLDGDVLKVVNSSFRRAEVFPDVVGRQVEDPLAVITLDGVRRNVLTINGQFPGPPIEVMEGAQVVVHVVNNLHDEAVSIHWHGLPQRANTWMDGVPHLTQCTIGIRDSFTYRFHAEPAGTFWYHSHFGYQRINGLAAPLIIHAKPPELPYSNVLIQDWYHDEGHLYFSTNPFAVPAVSGSGGRLYNSVDPRFLVTQVDGSAVSTLRYVSGLINGRGRFRSEQKWPLSDFRVTAGAKHLFRVTSSAGDLALEFSIDGHRLRVVAADGYSVEPQEFDSIILYPAERVDVEVVADQPVGRYWMRSRLLKDDTRHPGVEETLAIVTYQGANMGLEPTTRAKECNNYYRCIVMNCPFKYFPDAFFKDCVHMSDVRRKYTDKERVHFGLDREEPDEEHFLNLNFNKGANFNAINFVKPTAPLYQTDSESVDCDKVCSDDKVCTCTLTLNIPYDKIIQLVISNINPGVSPNVQVHPIHMHGHHFAVVRQGFADFNHTGAGSRIPFPIADHPNADVVCNDVLCRKARWRRWRNDRYRGENSRPEMNVRNPPLKDTVVIPASGYTVLRFRSNNPGAWLVHCHLQDHLVQGPMSFLVLEAADRIQPPPRGMPTCTANFTFSDQDYIEYRHRAVRAAQGHGGGGGGLRTMSPSGSLIIKTASSWYHNLPGFLHGPGHSESNDMSPLITLSVVFGIGTTVGIVLVIIVSLITKRCRRNHRVA